MSITLQIQIIWKYIKRIFDVATPSSLKANNLKLITFFIFLEEHKLGQKKGKCEPNWLGPYVIVEKYGLRE